MVMLVIGITADRSKRARWTDGEDGMRKSLDRYGSENHVTEIFSAQRDDMG